MKVFLKFWFLQTHTPPLQEEASVHPIAITRAGPSDPIDMPFTEEVMTP